MMKKVALITISSVPNYGSVLQAFASKKVIEQMGYSCEIIDYKYPNNWHYEHGTKRSPITYKIGVFLGLKCHHRKVKKLKSFRKRNYQFTSKYKDLTALKKAKWQDYEVIIVGSDQVWNPRFVHGDEAFMLSFIPNSIKKISIASSFACKKLPENYIDVFRKNLSRFDALSVREKNGIDIIKSQLKIQGEVKLLLDPTLLLSKEEWIHNIRRSSFKKEKKYLVLYGLYYAFDPRPQIFNLVAHYAKKYDLEVIAIEGYEAINGINVTNKSDASIEEFIDIFANADMVITSSFHGTAFALNFGVPFLSLTNGMGDDDRQSSLCQMVGLSNYIPYEAINHIPTLNELTIKEESKKKLSELRELSKKWITNNL